MRKSSEWYADYMKKSNNNSLAIMLYTQNKQVVHLYSLWTLCWLLYKVQWRFQPLHRNVGTILSPEKQHDCARTLEIWPAGMITQCNIFEIIERNNSHKHTYYLKLSSKSCHIPHMWCSPAESSDGNRS